MVTYLVVLTPVKKQRGQNLNAEEKQRSTTIFALKD